MRVSVLLALLLSTACVAQASLFSGFTVGRQFEYLGKFCFTWTASLEQLAGVTAVMSMSILHHRADLFVSVWIL